MRDFVSHFELGSRIVWDYDIVQVSAVIRNSSNPVSWEQRMREFVSHFELGSRIDYDYDIVPVSSIVHPLFVLQDYGNAENNFFCVLPKRTWPDYFSNLINKITPISTDDRDADSNSENSVLMSYLPHRHNFHIYVFSVLSCFRHYSFTLIVKHTNCSFSDVSDTICQLAEHVTYLAYVIDKNTYNFHYHIQFN